jgi:hypothetical protein
MNASPAVPEFRSLPFGSATLLTGILILGFVLLAAYQAWLHGPAYVLPVRDFMALMVAATFLFTIAYMIASKATEGSDIMLGALIAAFTAIIAYYFTTIGK